MLRRGKVKAEPYHSALTEPVAGLPWHVQSVKHAECFAFVHDLLSGPLPLEYQRCDVFCTDLPWPAGMTEFDRRAAVTSPRDYATFARAVCSSLAALRCPAVVVTGKSTVKHLPTTRDVRATKLNGAPAVALVYGDLLPSVDFTDSTTLARTLAEQFSCLGDFCCGYGRYGREFYLRRKAFVMSDYNAACIGQIASWLK